MTKTRLCPFKSDDLCMGVECGVYDEKEGCCAFITIARRLDAICRELAEIRERVGGSRME